MRLKYFPYLLFILSLFFACRKEMKAVCEVKSGNQGIIIKSYNDGSSPCWKFKQDKFIARNDSELHAVASYDTVGYSWCDGKIPENVDFSQFSLLGLRASTNGGGNFLRIATRNDDEKKIYYEVFPNTCSSDLAGHTSYNMVLIPKVPDDYTVEFTVKKD